MVNTSKILTVSYGTFSCTLEGFDDSFDTMKAIAEYFRDLAADDRYFGAEPPTPDADMLARIAEREIARRVEAHDQDGRIHLRAADGANDQPAPHSEPDAKLALPAGEDLAKPAMDSPAMSPARGMAEAAPKPESAEYPETDLPDLAEDEAHEIEPDAAPDAAAERDESAADSAADSVADKLRRIRAVASPAGDTFTGDSYNEDEHAQDFLGTSGAEFEEALDEALFPNTMDEPQPEVTMDEAQFEDIMVEAQADAAVPAGDENAGDLGDDTTLSVLNTLSALEADDTEPMLSEPAEPMADPSELAEDEGEEDALSSMIETAEDMPEEDTLAQLMADAMQGDAAEAATEAADQDTDQDASPDADRSDETADGSDEADAPAETGNPLNARVIKMKRSDFEAAMADDDAGEGIEEDIDTGAMLSPEAEAELQRELAEVEAELEHANAPADAEDAAGDRAEDHAEDDESDTAPVAGAEAEDEAEATARRREGAAQLGAEADAAEADRIFEEANSQLDDSTGSARRNAIQHLRAAVGAAKAEKEAGGDISSETDAAPYRLDLEQAVRPRRPQSSGEPRAERPNIARPAPLRLVAEQRVDTPSEPVRPRRISQAEIAETPASEMASDATGFAEYANSVGADSLPDLLEAAAAYLSDVEGRDQFSRPMLMTKLREIDEDGFSREDGLRSFGQLLRQGKLQKLKGGRFAVTEETDFRQAG